MICAEKASTPSTASATRSARILNSSKATSAAIARARATRALKKPPVHLASLIWFYRRTILAKNSAGLANSLTIQDSGAMTVLRDAKSAQTETLVAYAALATK